MNTFSIKLSLVCLIVACGVLPLCAADKDPAEYLPEDTFMLVTVPSVDGLLEKLKQTSMYGLYKEPSMQRFLVPAEKKIREAIDEELKKLWKKNKMAPPKELPWPTGRVTMATRLVKKEIKRPVYDWENFDGEGKPKIKKYQKQTSMEPEVILLADMGKNLEATKKLVKKLTDKAVEEGAKRRRETFRGIKFVIISPPKSSRKPGAPPESQGNDNVIYCFHDKTLIIGPHLKMFKDVLMRLKGSDHPKLSEDADYRKIMRTLGTGEVVFYMSIKSILKFSMKTAKADERKKMEKAFRIWGLNEMTGVGEVIQFAPRKGEEMRIKALLGIRGQKKGLVTMLVPPAKSTKPSRLLTKGMAGFVVAHYDLGKIFDQVAAMVLAFDGPVINKQLAGAMMMTGMGGRQAVNLRKDVLGQLVGPITVTMQTNKPYTSPDAQQIMLAVGTRDSGVLDSALGRIHDVFITRGNKELRREIRKRKLYLLPIGNLMGMIMGFGGGGKPDTAMAVADDNFVLASIKAVEQAIRDIGRKDIQPITADTMYQHVSRYLPAQATIYCYQNDRIKAALAWAQLKQAAKDAAKKPKREKEEMGEIGIEEFRALEKLKAPDKFQLRRQPRGGAPAVNISPLTILSYSSSTTSPR